MASGSIIMFYMAIGIIILITIILIIVLEENPKKMDKKRKETIAFDKFEDVNDVIKDETEEIQLENELDRIKEIALTQIQLENDLNIYEGTSSYEDRIDKLEKYIESQRLLSQIKTKKNPIVEGTPIRKIKQNQKKFNADLFKNWCQGVFEIIQTGTEKELQIIKSLIAKPVYNKIIKQMRNFEKDNLEYKKEEVFIEETKIFDYARAMKKEEIKVYIRATMKEYIINLKTQKVIRGNKEKNVTKEYIMTFLNKNTNEEEGLIHNCPNCGAETTEAEFGKCSYCDTLIIPIRYNWILTKIELL